MEIGAQFFTLRDYCKNLHDFAESLKKVADIGYKTVQISGVCPYEPEWLAEQLKKNGLRCVLTHTNVAENPLQTAKNHDVFDCTYAGLGYYGFDGTRENYDAFISQFTPVAQVLKDNGKYFMYHNHAHEFQKLEGKTIFARLAEDMPADLMGFTVDTFWVQYGGSDPAQWIEDLKGRVPCIHLKDIDHAHKMTPVGDGNLNWNRIFKAAEASGTKYMLVEQDDCYDADPFACLRRSYDFLVSNGFR